MLPSIRNNADCWIEKAVECSFGWDAKENGHGQYWINT